MKPSHPVELLCCAIATQEGWFDPDPSVIPRARKNPGDLRYAKQIGTIPPADYGSGPVPVVPIATFQDEQYGITALFRQVWLQVAEGQTVRRIIAQWAPPNENNTSKYLEDVLEWTGLPADTPVLDLLPALVNLNLPS